MDKTYRLFISHSWAYSNTYDSIVNFLNDGNISFYDHSVPKHDPVHTSGSDKELRDAIDAKIKNTSCVIISAGVYSTHSKWINIEIEIANKYGKKIIAVEHWGAERSSDVVKRNAHKVVKWQGKSLCDAIKELA